MEKKKKPNRVDAKKKICDEWKKIDRDQSSNRARVIGYIQCDENVRAERSKQMYNSDSNYSNRLDAFQRIKCSTHKVQNAYSN